MPLVTRKTLLHNQTKGMSASVNSEKTFPRKAVSKSVYKGKLLGKKTEKKVLKAKAGYELYSDWDSPEYHSPRYVGEEGFIRTLIEDYQSAEALQSQDSLTESAPGAEIHYTVEKHLPGNMDKTPFNKRLCSSTPDPERLDKFESLETLLKQFQILGDTGEFENLDHLSDAQREHIRQVIDAALMKETRAENTKFQEQCAKLLSGPTQTDPQKQEAIPVIGQTLTQQTADSSLSSVDQPVPDRIPASVAGQRPPPPYKHAGRSLSKPGRSGLLPSQQSGDQKTAVTRVTSTSATTQQPAARGKKPASSMPASQSLGMRAKEASSRKADLWRVTPHPVPSGVSCGPSQSAVWSCASPGKHAVTPSASPSHLDRMGHASVPSGAKMAASGIAPKPMKCSVDHTNQQFEKILTRASQKDVQKRRNISPGPSVEEYKKWVENARMSNTKFDQASSKLPNNGGKKQTEAGFGHGTRQTVENRNEHDSIPKWPDERHPSATSDQFNRNNSNSYGTGQLNASQNACSDSEEQEVGPAQDCGQAAVVSRTSGSTDSPSSSEAEANKRRKDLTIKKYFMKSSLSDFIGAVQDLKKHCAGSADDELNQHLHWLELHAENLGEMQDMFEKQKNAKTIAQRSAISRLNGLTNHMEGIIRRESDPEVVCELFNTLIDHTKQTRELEETQATLSKEREEHRQEMERLKKQIQQSAAMLKEKNELRTSCQEQEMNMNNLKDQLYSSSLQTQRLESQVEVDKHEIRSLKTMMKVKDSTIHTMQELLGNVKQAATEVMHHLEHGTEVKHLLTLHCSRRLQEFVQSSSYSMQAIFESRPYPQTTAPTRQSHLDTSGNQRMGRALTSGRSGNENLNPVVRSSDYKAVEAPQQLATTKETTRAMTVKNELFPKDITNFKGPAVAKESRNTGPESQPGLTMAAIAAHNQKLGTAQKDAHRSSVHSDGAKHQKAEVGNQSRPYHSDTMSMVAPDKDGSGSAGHKYGHIESWSADVESERHPVAGSGKDLFCRRNAAHQSPPSHDNSDAASETESIATLSEVPISQGKAGSLLETQSLHSLSETSISEMASFQSVKEVKSGAGSGKTSTSMVEPGRKYPRATPTITPSATSVYASSPPVSPRKKNLQVEWAARGRTSPSTISLNSALTNSTSSVTQRDFFQGSTLDLSVSTIPEDAQSTMTGASLSAMGSVDNDKFAEKIEKLTGVIDKRKEDLRQYKDS
ncbi:hypothetical protein ACOMHN_000243 [Nucella lapillus]